jgi:hypothetical protein
MRRAHRHAGLSKKRLPGRAITTPGLFPPSGRSERGPGCGSHHSPGTMAGHGRPRRVRGGREGMATAWRRRRYRLHFGPGGGCPAPLRGDGSALICVALSVAVPAARSGREGRRGFGGGVSVDGPRFAVTRDWTRGCRTFGARVVLGVTAGWGRHARRAGGIARGPPGGCGEFGTARARLREAPIHSGRGAVLAARRGRFVMAAPQTGFPPTDRSIE